MQRYIESIRRRLEGLSLKLFGPRGAGIAIACLRVTKEIRATTKPTILVVSRPLFDKDIAEIDREGRFNWLKLSGYSLNKVQKRILPPEAQRQRAYYTLLSDPAYRSFWQAVERLATALLTVLRMRGRLDAVLSSHLDYWQDEGLRRACARFNIPFLALCHENYNIPKTYQARGDEYSEVGFRFNGTAIATFSEHMRDLFVRRGVCSSERVVVTGAPRFDGWQRIANAPGRRIVLLSFLKPQKYYESADFFFGILDTLRGIVARSPGWELIVKCKEFRDNDAVTVHVGSEPQVTVAGDIDLPKLLSTASIIVGSNSLSMVESLLSGAELFVPISPNARADGNAMMFDPSDELVSRCFHFIDSAAALESAIENKMTPSPIVDRSARLTLVQRYIHYTEDVPSSRRVADFIEAFMKPVPQPAFGSKKRANA